MAERDSAGKAQPETLAARPAGQKQAADLQREYDALQREHAALQALMAERRCAEDALRDSERQLRQQKTLIDLARDPIFIWDFDGGIVEWNKGCEALYGFSRDEAVGKSKVHLLSTVVPGSSFEDLCGRLLREGTWSGELRHTARGGRVLTVESLLQLEEMDGRRFVFESTRDISERKRWQERQELLLKELTHRVKNILTVVQAIAGQTMRGTSSAQEFVESFRGRLAALAGTHDLLVQSDWAGTDLAELAANQVKPYQSLRDQRIAIAGPSVHLPADMATSFGLVLHELSARSVRHGALAVPEGRVDLSWMVTPTAEASLLSLTWRERNDPAAVNSTPAGMGGTFIERAIPNAKVLSEVTPEGLQCRIEVALPAPTHK